MRLQHKQCNTKSATLRPARNDRPARLVRRIEVGKEFSRTAQSSAMVMLSFTYNCKHVAEILLAMGLKNVLAESCNYTNLALKSNF